MRRFLAVLLAICSCTSTYNAGKTKLLASDFNLFRNTPAWPLAESVNKGDSVAILAILAKDKRLVDFQEPVYGQTLLTFAVYHRKYNAVKLLLKHGADPNKQDIKHGTSPFMIAAGLGGGGKIHPFADPRYLKLLLKFGGNPNAVQSGNRSNRNNTQYTPLMFACLSGVFDYAQILVDSGADLNAGASNGMSSLYAAIIGGNPEIVLFLLKRGADYKQVLFITNDGKKMYLSDALELWNFDKGLKEYKEQIEIVDFLKKNHFN